MKVAAFDSRPFRRGRRTMEPGAPPSRRYAGFHTHLGMGVRVSDEGEFREAFAAGFARLKGEFGVETGRPFLSADGLLRHGRPTAVAFADRLVASVQHLIEGAYCSYVLLSSRECPSVRVGGAGCPALDVPTARFIDGLGPMFPYLTAEMCARSGGCAGAEIRIGSFASRRTRAWDSLEGRGPRVHWRGGECDPAIACAGLLALLTDAKLFAGRLRLDRDGIARAWAPYPFGVDVGVHDAGSLDMYAWYSDAMIDARPYAARPAVFLSVDEFEDPSAVGGAVRGPGRRAGGAAAPPEERPPPFHDVVAQLPVYDSAIRLAFEMSGSLKIFGLGEDAGLVRDRDAFVYVGEKSRRVGVALGDMADMAVVSGAGLVGRHKKRSNKVTSHSW